MKVRELLFVLLLAGVSACSPSNPLLGTWEIDGTRSDNGAIMGGMGKIESLEFTTDTVTTRLKKPWDKTGGTGEREPVKYTIESEYIDALKTSTGDSTRFFLEADGSLRWQLSPKAAVYWIRSPVS